MHATHSPLIIVAVGMGVNRRPTIDVSPFWVCFFARHTHSAMQHRTSVMTVAMAMAAGWPLASASKKEMKLGAAGGSGGSGGGLGGMKGSS